MPLPPISLEDFRRWSTRKWTEATQPLVDDLSHTGWVMDAQRTLDDAVRQAQSWMPQPAPPPPAAPPTLELFEAEGQPELMGPPSPTLGQRVGMGAQSFGDTLGQTAQDWTSRAQGAISGLSSSWDADLERLRREREASEAQFPTPQETGPAGFTLPQTGTPEGEALTTELAATASGGPSAAPQAATALLEAPGAILEQQRQQTQAFHEREAAGDQAYADWANRMRERAGGQPVAPEEALTPDEVRFWREAGMSGAGLRRGQTGRLPRLSPEELAQRARDSAAEQRVFDAISRLWRRGPAGEAAADDLRFLAVGKGEAGEAAAREYLAGKGLPDVLPAGSRGVSLASTLASLPEWGGEALERGRAFLEEQRQATRDLQARDRARDEALLDLTPSGQALTGEERQRRLDALRFAGEAGQGTALGLRGALSRVPLAGRVQDLSQLNEVVASSPLSGVRSLTQNVLGGGVRTLERLGMRLFSGNPARTVPELAGEVGAMAGELRPALGRARQAWSSGPTPRNPGATGVAGASNALVNAPDVEAQILTAGIRANAATDEVWRSLNEAAGKATGTRRGLTGAALDDFAREAGNYATVTGANSPIANQLNKVRGWMDDPSRSAAERVVGYIANGFAPYVGMVERVLFGTLQTTTGPVTAPLELAARKWLQARGHQGALTPALREQLVGRMVLGSVVDGTFAWQTVNGNLYGRPPRSATKRRELERQGARWNSIRIGGTWVPLTYLGTVGTSAALIADATTAAQDAQEEGKPFPEIVGDMVNRAASYALDESYAEDLAAFLKATDDDRFLTALTELGAGYASRPLAPITGAFGAADPYARETATAQGQAARVVPGGRTLLPTKIDPYTGEDVRRQGSGLGRYLGLNAGEEVTAVERELGARGVTVTSPRGEYAGEKQSAAAQRAIRRAIGSEIGEAARTTIRSRAYQEASDAEKTKLLERAVRQGRQLADVRLGESVKRDAKRQADYEYLAVPRYEGVSSRLSADEVRRENLRTAAARSALTEAKQRYRDNPDKGRAELLRSDPETVKLAENRPPLSASELRRKREQIYAKHGLSASGEPLEEEP